MVLLIIFLVIAVVVALVMLSSRRDKRVNNLSEKIEHNERRSRAFDEVERYNNMN